MGIDTNKGLLTHNAEKYAKNRDVDPAKIDFQSIIDTELSETENWQRIEEEVEKRMDSALSENIPDEDAIAAKEAELHRRFVNEIEQEKEEQIASEFEGDGHEEVQQYYHKFNHYIKSICRDHHHALMVNAEPGIGKSYQTNQTLVSEIGKERFKKSPAVASPFQFYKMLWELENSARDVLVLDDIEGLLRSKKALSIMKQATWSESGDRYVGWNSSPSKLQSKDGQDIPEEFKFTGKLIMIFNEVPEDDIIFESLKDRCFYYELSFSYEQKCKLIRALADKGLDHGVAEEDRKEIASWLIEVTTPSNDQLNLRTFERALKHFNASADINEGDVTWKDIIKEGFDVDRKLEAARAVIKDGSYTTPGERQDAFKERTGMTARTYRNAREKLRENSEEIDRILS